MFIRHFSGMQYDLDCVSGKLQFKARTVSEKELSTAYISGTGIPDQSQSMTIATMDEVVKTLKEWVPITVDGETFNLMRMGFKMSEAVGKSLIKKENQKREYILFLE